MKKQLMLLVLLFASAGASAKQPPFEVGEFHGGLANITIGDKCGYFNKSGKMVIKPKFDWCTEFSEGLASVKQGDKYGFVDASGKLIIKPKYHDALSFSNGLAVVLLEKKVYGGAGPTYGFINKSGKIVITLEKGIEPDGSGFINGALPFKMNDKYGFLGKNGNDISVLIQPKFDSVQKNWFSEEGLAAVKLGNKWGFIGRDGEWFIKPQAELAGNFQEGLACVEVDGKWGYIAPDGKWVIQPQYGTCADFHDGLASGVEFAGGRGVINKLGIWVVKPLYAFVDDFDSAGRAFIRTRDDKVGVIDTSGSFIVKPISPWMGRPSEGSIAVQTFFTSDISYGVGYMNYDGGWVVSPMDLDSMVAPYIK